MNTDERREQILYTLKQTNTSITGSELANIFKVSRQIIVGDIERMCRLIEEGSGYSHSNIYTQKTSKEDDDHYTTQI